jgi:Ca2+-binding EF-hand superfamily protein
MMRKLEEWRENNAAFKALSRASAEVRLAFLSGSFEWLRAEAKDHSRFRVCPAITDALQQVLTSVPKPLPTEVVQRLLSEYRQDLSMTRMYFPFEQFLSMLTADQITDEIRSELRRIHLQFVPTPTGKVEEHNKEIRDLLAGLLRIAGEKEPDPGRGPWSQIVFDEIAAEDDITRAGWEALLEHCRALEQTVPSAKWKGRARELMVVLGETEVITAMLRPSSIQK